MPRQRTIFARRSVLPRTYTGGDDGLASVVRRDLSGGMNSRIEDSSLAENESTVLQNVDIGTPGARIRRPGVTLIEDFSNNAGTGLYGFDPQGFTPNLMVTDGTYLRRWEGSGSVTSVKTDFTTGLQTNFVKVYKTGVGDVLFVTNGTDNVFEMNPSTYAMTDLGNTNTSPPKTKVYCWYGNRPWALKGGLLYFGDAAPSDYSTAWDRAINAFLVPVGEERALLPTRDLGIIIAGKEQIWAIAPSAVPAPDTDWNKPQPLVTDYGCAAGKTFKQVGDDYYYFSHDGLRSLNRTVQDKLQGGVSFPLSYKLKDEFESINWAYITNATAIYWENKFFLALPTNGSTYNNQVWVYYPATQGWMIIDGWNVGDWAKFRVNGQERLYYVDSNDGTLVRAWFGTTDNGTAIEYQEEGRGEDLGHPIVKKNGGELCVVVKATGNYDITVSAAFDNGSYNVLGVINTSGSLVTFPTTFPVNFGRGGVVRKKFHLDSYGSWYQVVPKFTTSDLTSAADDITIYEHSIAAHVEEYTSEEN